MVFYTYIQKHTHNHPHPHNAPLIPCNCLNYSRLSCLIGLKKCVLLKIEREKKYNIHANAHHKIISMETVNKHIKKTSSKSQLIRILSVLIIQFYYLHAFILFGTMLRPFEQMQFKNKCGHINSTLLCTPLLTNSLTARLGSVWR